MKKDRFTRKQRRHAHFVLECEGKYLTFKEDGICFGFHKLETANAFAYEKALILHQAIKTKPTTIKILTKINGKLKAL
jgi:hypothetical protein